MSATTHVQTMPHLLIISNDVVQEKMAGPGIRYWELARSLAYDVNVTLAIPNHTTLESPLFRIHTYQPERPDTLKGLLSGADLVLFNPSVFNKSPGLEKFPGRIIIDLYDPILFENTHYYKNQPLKAQIAIHQNLTALTNQVLRIGDFFLAGNDRQRDFWLGMLAANGRINPLTIQEDGELKQLISVVGIGLPDKRPVSKPILREKIPEIPAKAKIILWGGGLWDWLDPVTLVKAWPAVIEKIPEARLVFLGTRHPNPEVPEHEIVQQVIQTSFKINETTKTIHFIEWLTFDDYQALLVEADVGVSLHPMHIETRFSIRKRVLDYIWAGLPIVSTQGDVIEDWVSNYGFGITVPDNNPQAVSEAILSILDQPKGAWYQKYEPFFASHCWEVISEPLRNYCLKGAKARDQGNIPANTLSGRAEAASLLSRARFIFQTQGVRNTLLRTWRYIRRRLKLF